MIKTLVRTAEQNDCPGITDLTNQLGYPSSLEKVCEILNMVLEHKDHEIFVAECDNRIVAYIHLISTMRLGSRNFVEIAAFVVHESYRNMGVGDALIKETEKWTKETGLRDIRIRSNIIREEAHKFFKNRGFENIKTQEVFLKHINVNS
jgi:N-acetylglutamate synthase-like GNAT family acetyltransferase